MVLRLAVLTSRENLFNICKFLGPTSHLTRNSGDRVICFKNSPNVCDKRKNVKITKINSSYYVPSSLTPG